MHVQQSHRKMSRGGEEADKSVLGMPVRSQLIQSLTKKCDVERDICIRASMQIII